MMNQFAILILAATVLTASLGAQSMSQSDPTYRPTPLYSKSEKKKIEKFRMVHGIVKNEQDNPVSGALVNLKNLKTNQTETFVTKGDGKYLFDELSREQDYELSASFSGKTTPVKKLSHFDTRSNSMRILTFGEPDDTATAKSSK